MGMIKVHNWTTSKVCVQLAKVVTLNYQQLYSISSATTTDKRTDVWSRDFIIWKINSGQWAVVWAGLWNKRVWADYKQLLRPVFSLFRGQKKNLNQKKILNFFENTIATALKSYIILFLQKKILLIFWTRKSEKTGFF